MMQRDFQVGDKILLPMGAKSFPIVRASKNKIWYERPNSLINVAYKSHVRHTEHFVLPECRHDLALACCRECGLTDVAVAKGIAHHVGCKMGEKEKAKGLKCEFRVGDRVQLKHFEPAVIEEFRDNKTQALLRYPSGGAAVAPSQYLKHAPLTLEMGKGYRRRDGKGPCLVDGRMGENDFHVSHGRKVGAWCHYSDGRWAGHKKDPRPDDLVQEWREGEDELLGEDSRTGEIVKVVRVKGHAPVVERSCPICYDMKWVGGVPCGRCNFAIEREETSDSILVAVRSGSRKYATDEIVTVEKSESPITQEDRDGMARGPLRFRVEDSKYADFVQQVKISRGQVRVLAEDGKGNCITIEDNERSWLY